MMSAESSYNPYRTMHLTQVAAQSSESQANSRNNRSIHPLSSFPVTRKQRAWILLVVPTVLLLIIAGLLCFMALWLLYRNVHTSASFDSIAKDALIVDEAAQWCRLLRSTIPNAKCDPNKAPTLLGLTFADLLSKVVSLSLTYLMAVATLCAGASWLRATSAGEARDMPTPLQYGLLLTMASGTFSSAWEGWCYLVWRRRRRANAPSLVKNTFACLMVLLILSSVISIADTWLHFSTQSLRLTSTYSVASPQGFEPGLAINQSACVGAAYPNTCVFEGESDYAGTVAIQDAGNQAVANTSDSFRVLTFGSTAKNITAVIIPTTSVIPTGMSFHSSSYGVGAICEPISCDWSVWSGWSYSLQSGYVLCPTDGTTLQNNTANFSLQGPPTLTDASSVYLVYNLQTAGINVPQMAFAGQNATNPFGMAQMMGWGAGSFGQALTDGSDYFFSEFDENNNEYITWFVGTCNISIYDVELSYTNGTYDLTNRTLSDQDTTTMLFLPFVADLFLQSFGPRMVINLGSQVSNNNTDFLVEVARQVSQLATGLNAGILMPAVAASNVKMEETFIASRYPLNALGMLWAATVLYLACGVGLVIRSIGEQGDVLPTDPLIKSSPSDPPSPATSTPSTLVLARQRMVKPLAIVAEHFVLSGLYGNHPDGLLPALSVKAEVMDMFMEAKDEHRLGIGIGNSLSPGNNERERMFSIG